MTMHHVISDEHHKCISNKDDAEIKFYFANLLETKSSLYNTLHKSLFNLENLACGRRKKNINNINCNVQHSDSVKVRIFLSNAEHFLKSPLHALAKCNRKPLLFKGVNKFKEDKKS